MGDEQTAIRELARNPVMLAEAKTALPALQERATRAAGRDGVTRIIGRRLALLQTPQKTEAEWNAWWEDYHETLADLPEAALEAGMSAYIRDPTAEWMPLPGRLRALAMSSPNMAARAYSRARAAVVRAGTLMEPAADTRERPTKAEIDAMMADYRAKLPRKPEVPPAPPTHGPTDATGLTREMRELMGIDGPGDSA